LLKKPKNWVIEFQTNSIFSDAKRQTIVYLSSEPHKAQEGVEIGLLIFSSVF